MTNVSKNHISDEQFERDLRQSAKETRNLFTMPEGWRDRLFDRINREENGKPKGLLSSCLQKLVSNPRNK